MVIKVVTKAEKAAAEAEKAKEKDVPNVCRISPWAEGMIKSASSITLKKMVLARKFTECESDRVKKAVEKYGDVWDDL